MKDKDITERHILEQPDIFADVFNRLVRWCSPQLPEVRASELKHLPVHTFRDTARGIRELERDLYMKWCPDWSPDGALVIGNENQTKEERWTIGRLPNYAAGNLMRVLEDGGTALPEIGVILYFGQKKWKGPKTLRELYGHRLASLTPDLIGNDRVTVVDIGDLPWKAIESLESDFREIARLVKCCRSGIPYTGAKGRLKYFVATARVMAAIAGIELSAGMLEELRNMKEEDQTMEMVFPFLSLAEAQKARQACIEAREEGLKAGMRDGIEKGIEKGKAEERNIIRKVMEYLNRKGRGMELGEILESSKRMEEILEEIAVSERS